MLGAAESLQTGERILILADSRAAISAVKRAGRTGKVRTEDLKKLLEVFERREDAERTEDAPSYGRRYPAENQRVEKGHKTGEWVWEREGDILGMKDGHKLLSTWDK